MPISSWFISTYLLLPFSDKLLGWPIGLLGFGALVLGSLLTFKIKGSAGVTFGICVAVFGCYLLSILISISTLDLGQKDVITRSLILTFIDALPATFLSIATVGTSLHLILYSRWIVGRREKA